MNWLKRIFCKKKNREVKVYSEHKEGIVFKCNNPKYDNVDMSDSILVLSRPFGEAIWVDDSKQNILSPSEQYLERLKSLPQEDFKKEYFQKPEYTEEDRRIDDSHDKGISEEREIHQSWIDDSYNSPLDSTSYDSSNSYDDSSTSSGDW